MNKQKNQWGFAPLAVVLVIVAITAIGFGGWYVWQQNNSAPTSEQAQPTTTKPQPQSPQPTPATDPSEGGKYLVITEWGVRFLLPEGLWGDVGYGIETSVAKETAWFEVGEIAALPGSDCKLKETTTTGSTGQSGGIGAFIVRTSEKVGPEQEPFLAYPNIEIGSYWYSGGRVKYSESCVNDENKTQQTADVRASIIYSFEHLEPTPKQ